MGNLPDTTPFMDKIPNTDLYRSFIECGGRTIWIVCPEDKIPDTSGLALIRGKVVNDIKYDIDPCILVSSIEIKLKSGGSQVTETVSASLACPANLHAYDSQGRHIGMNATDGIDFEIPDAYYSGPDSDIEEITVFNQSRDIKFVVKALDQGEFNLTIEQTAGTVLREIVYQDISLTQTTEAIIDVSEANPTYTMQIDDDGDGTPEHETLPDSIKTMGHDSHTIPLHTGWNLISTPLIPEDTGAASVLSPIIGNYSIIWEYNASDTADHWKKYDPSAPFGNDLTDMEPGKGYWILVPPMTM